MSEFDISISNGTCYSASGEELDDSFIPCGNDAFGYQTCCGAGDKCLADNACFGYHGSGYGSSLTYMAGCTDPDYDDDKCPDKKDIDQPWIALTLCDDSDEWAVCSQEGDPTTLQPGSTCTCTQARKATIGFRDARTLADLASLPDGTGQSIEWIVSPTEAGPAVVASSSEPSSDGSREDTKAEETSTADPSTSETKRTWTFNSEKSEESRASNSDPKTGSIPATIISTDAGLTGTSTRGVSQSAAPTGSRNDKPDTPSSSLGLGAKIGIGVGVGLGLLVFVMALFIFYRRRRRVPPPSGTESKKAPTSTWPSLAEADGKTLSELEGQAADPSAVRSELDDRRVPLTGAPARKLSPVVELPGSEAWHVPQDRLR